ncbi:MAG: hypothetical protein WC994_11355 [Brumimicrobium sp.]
MRYTIIIILALLFSSCNGISTSKTSESTFIGVWKIEDREILNNIEFEIFNNDKNELKGIIRSINDNKYVQLFMNEEDQFITNIKRKSNTEFIITEKMIAAPLFSVYDQKTTKDFNVSFQNKDTIFIGKNGAEGKYIRVSIGL